MCRIRYPQLEEYQKARDGCVGDDQLRPLVARHDFLRHFPSHTGSVVCALIRRFRVGGVLGDAEAELGNGGLADIAQPRGVKGKVSEVAESAVMPAIVGSVSVCAVVPSWS